MDEKLTRTIASCLEETLQISGWIDDPKITRINVEILYNYHGQAGAVEALKEWEDAIKFVNETLGTTHDADLVKLLPKEVD